MEVIYFVFTACTPYNLVLSVHCHWGDVIKPKVTFYRINWLDQTKDDVGEVSNSSKLFKRFVIILGCDFHFNVISVYEAAEYHSAKNGVSLVLPDNQSCFVLLNWYSFSCEAHSFYGSFSPSRHVGVTAKISQHTFLFRYALVNYSSVS